MQPIEGINDSSKRFFYLIRDFFRTHGRGLTEKMFNDYQQELEVLFFDEASGYFLNPSEDFDDAFFATLKQTQFQDRQQTRLLMMPAGSFAVDFAQKIQDENIEIIGYLDNYKTDAAAGDNKPIHKPEGMPDLSFDAVLIATPSYVAQRTMEKQLKGLLGDETRIIKTADLALGSKIDQLAAESRASAKKKAAVIHQRMAGHEGKKVLFAASGFPQHYLATIRALRRRGCWVGLLTLSPNIIYGNGHKKYKPEFDAIHSVNHNMLEFFDLLSRIKADCLYTFDFFMNNHLALLLRDIWPRKMFLEVYDLSDNVDLPKNFVKCRMEEETGLNLTSLDDHCRKRVYQQVDGLIFRDSPVLMEKAEKIYGLQNKSLQFLPFPEHYTKLKELDGCEHIVFSGHIPNLKAELVYTVFDMAKAVTRQKIHMHFYNPSDPETGLLNEFITEARHNPFFHYHQPLPIDVHNYILKRYNWGWLVYDFKNCAKDQMTRNAYTFTSRLLSYISAGLPCICSAENTYQAEIIEKYGVGVIIEREQVPELKRILEKSDYPALCRNVQKLQREWDIHRNIDRLLNFME